MPTATTNANAKHGAISTRKQRCALLQYVTSLTSAEHNPQIPPRRQQIYGDPIDKDHWAANNPATIIRRDPSRLLGLGIYLEVGDQDTVYLNHGTEFVHRVLFDAGISHEYRLVKGADHVGASLAPRSLDAFAFVGRQLNPPK